MNVVIVSQCQKRAAGRTARVLDAYAWRKGDRTWMTPITQEGLETIRSELRRIATRQTAVACYAYQGHAGLRLAWVVGSRKAFGPEGEVPVAGTSVRRHNAQDSQQPEMRAELRLACLLASVSGYLHDLGKFGLMFQQKLKKPRPMADAIRHEWLSLHILLQQNGLDDDEGWRSAWASTMTRMGAITSRDDFSAGIGSARAAIMFLVFTHHRLPKDVGENVRAMILDDSTYFDSVQKVFSCEPVSFPSATTRANIQNTLRRIDKVVEGFGTKARDPLFWRSVVILARMALILADHSVSSLDKSGEEGHGQSIAGTPGAVFANTVRSDDGRSVLNQQLDWHLQAVGSSAAIMLPRMLAFDPPGLSEAAMERLRAPASGRFQWQSDCAHALRQAQATCRLPTLVFNVAGTGTGKTRMNVLAVAALREGKPVRIATGLNLRTLTLQTRDAYAEQLGMSRAELACVIGSAVAVRLHDSRHAEVRESVAPVQSIEDEDGNLPEMEFEVTGDPDPAPPWLAHFLDRSRNLAAVVMSPVVVCTVDFLVRAGDPTEKANQALTMLRLMKSDLVLDEIDSYDPKSLVAVMRLVTAAAMWGRHVVTSSATLARPVAKALYAAYDLGIRMGASAGCIESTKWRQVVTDDGTGAHIATAKDQPQFEDWFGSTITGALSGMGQRHFRPMTMLPVNLEGPASARIHAVLGAIHVGCVEMHDRHRWTLQQDGQPHEVSIGLVRIANIRRAVQVAKYLSKQIPNARICCYHSQLSRIHRFMLERELDAILARHPQDGVDPAELFTRSPAIRQAVARSRAAGSAETVFIVVATPVEEIGRDHDFDWAIIEPSSTQSIVQAAGRVNRHRMRGCAQPNVAVLQYNFLEAEQGEKFRACFTRPGLEVSADGRSTHPLHDLERLVNWTAIAACGQVDARLRFLTDTHPFAQFDDHAADDQIGRHSHRFMRSDSPLWFGASTYDAVPLREAAQMETWSKDDEGEACREEPSPRNPRIRAFMRRALEQERDPKSAWLAWSHDELLTEAAKLGLEPLEAFSVEVRPVSESQQASGMRIIENVAFGYYSSSE